MKSVMDSLQWMLFMLMGSIAVPIAIASTFGLTEETLVLFISRTLFILGVAGILQVLFGHLLPIQEGTAGVWWGVFTLYATMGPVMFGNLGETLRVLEFCAILSGVIFIVLGLLGVVNKIAKLFTPTVMGAYLVLLVLQLSGTFLKGMVGISASHPGINLKIALLSALTVAAAYIARRFKKVGGYSTLISIVFGWFLFIIFKEGNSPVYVKDVVRLPELFPFGKPRIEAQMVVNVVCLTLLLLTNLMASVKAVQIAFDSLKQPYTPNRLNNTSIVSGVIHILAGAFGSVGPVPISGSAAFIVQSKIVSRLPFIAGNLMIIAISLSPKVTALFATLPVAVGFASLVPTFGIGTTMIALGQIESATNKAARNLTVGATWFIGVGIMFLPPAAFKELGPLATSILSNGLVIGAVVAVLLDSFFPSTSLPNSKSK